MRKFNFLLLILTLLSAPSFGAPNALSVFQLKNQFGEQSINYVLGNALPLGNSYLIFTGATAPVNGTTGDNYAGKGSLYTARDTGVLYINTGLVTNPTWTVLAGSGGTTSALLTGFVSGAGTVSATDTILQGFNKLAGNTQNLPVISNVITGYVSGAGSISASDTILTAINKLNGNAAAISTVANAALPSASFTDAAVTGKLLTGYVSGAGTVSATDSILQAVQKLNGNIGVYTEAAPSLTFDHSVGAKTITIRKVGKLVSLDIPSAAISDGLGTVAASTALDAAYRPGAAVTFSVLVIDNGTTRKAGQVVVGADGVLTFSVLGAGFTNAAAAGWDACAVQYAIP